MISDEETLKAYIELWKQAIDVQKHFNDIELRVRSLALTLLTFALGGATLAVKDGRNVNLWGVHIKIGVIVLFAGLISWFAFYFMDQVWYHRLLVGAVKHGERLEAVLRQNLPEAGLTRDISNNSPYKVSIPGMRFTIHSSSKIRIFYLSIALLLVVLGIAVQLGVNKH